MGILGMESEFFGEQIRQFQERMIAGWFGYPLIGTPEQVAEELGRISAAGVEGVIFGFLDYNEELKYFERKMMPPLEQAGLLH